jgi:hypothetical protein
LMAASPRRAVYPARHPTAEFVREAGLSAQLLAQALWSLAQVSWSARPKAEASSADRCVVECRPEARLREACAAGACRRPAGAEPRSVARWDARAPRAEVAEAAGVRASAQQRAAEAAAVPLAQPVAVAGEAVPASLQAAEAEAAVEAPASLRVAAAAAEEEVAEPVSLPAAAEAAVPLVLREAAARPLAAPLAFHPGRALPWPAPPRAARFAHAMPCSQIAPPTARLWQAARGEVWS